MVDQNRSWDDERDKAQVGRVADLQPLNLHSGNPSPRIACTSNGLRQRADWFVFPP